MTRFKATAAGDVPFSAEEEAARDAEEATNLLAQQAMDAVNAAEVVRKLAIQDNVLCINLVTQLTTATSAQISAYIDNNVTDLASARTMLKRIVHVLALLYRGR